MKNIAAAFVKAQTEFGKALKTSANPFFKSKYADLSVVIEAVIDALHFNGIALLQNCHESETGVIVETISMHSSGENISCGKLSVPAAKNDPQGYGSALTYARRYSLMAACGIAPEDDDGNHATKAVVEQKKESVRKQLAALPDDEAEKEYIKWTEVKSLLLDEQGVSDNERITSEWNKLPSNVRSAIKRYGASLSGTQDLDSLNNQHLADISKE